MDVGGIVELGRLRGDLVGTDASGRYVAVGLGKVLTVYDTHDGLTAVASWQVDHQGFDQVAVHPGGSAVVALTKDDWCLERWQAGDETPVRAATEIAGSAAALDYSGYGLNAAGWLRYSADGAYLYFGEAVRDAPARLNLLDPATLTRLDSVSPVGVHVGDEPIEDWGEDLQSCCASAPSTAVAFAANAGDDPVVFGVVEVVEGRLELHSGRSPQSWVDIPGERVMAITCVGDDELVVLDSDELVTRVRWRDRPMAATGLTHGGDVLSPDEGTEAESAAVLRGLLRDDADERLLLTGPVSASGRLLAIAVDHERWNANGGLELTTIGLVVVDGDCGERRAFLEFPAAEFTDISNGTICRRDGSHIHLSRWVPPRERDADALGP